MTKNINITIPADLHHSLKQEALTRGIPLKALIIAILSEMKK
jgi:predicted DNA binding CopG/RHH family protein